MESILIITLALAIALPGCETLSTKERHHEFTSENDAYVGHSLDDLIKGKGVPTGTATLTDGSKMVEYYNAQVEISGGGYYPFSTATYHTHTNGTKTWVYMNHMQTIPVRSWNKVCRIDFLVNPQNIVESWKFDGKGCY